MEIVVGIAAALLFLGVRWALSPVAGTRAPYSFAFLAVVSACVLAGWRSGLLALFLSQLLAWLLIVSNSADTVPPATAAVGGLLAATISQLLVLAVVALYQREVDKVGSRRKRRMDLLSEALREIDHRVRNNYQTVLALVQLQGQRSEDPAVKDALNQVVDRITAVSRATERLTQRGEDLGRVRLGDHLRELCGEVESGLSREGIELRCKFAEVSATAEKAAAVSIILNELLTNALKHAFDGDRTGVIRVDSRMSPAGFELVVADDGHGMKAHPNARGAGLGHKLVETFLRQLGATHEVSSSEAGTTHRIVVPKLD